MTKGGIAALYGMCGLLSGFGVSYFIMKRRSDRMIQREIEKFKWEWTEAKKKYEESDEDEVVDPDYIPINKKKLEEHRMKSTLDGGRVNVPHTDYHKMSAIYRKSEADISKNEEEALNASPEEEEPTEGGDIFFISAEEYEDNPIGDRIEMDWYIIDDVLLDNYGEEVEDRDRLFGELLGENMIKAIKNEPSDVIFIRNTVVKCDYCINIDDEEPYALINQD